MVKEVVGEKLFEQLEIAATLHLFSIAADNRLRSFAGCRGSHDHSPIYWWRYEIAEGVSYPDLPPSVAIRVKGPD
jgi:hypothetical protein